MRQLVLHLGPQKTGTTSLQAWLELNRERLRAQGMYYPDVFLQSFPPRISLSIIGDKAIQVRVPRDAQHLLAWTLGGQVCSPTADVVWDQLLRELGDIDASTIVISSEHFIRLEEQAIKFVRDAFRNFRVTIIYYLRNPAQRIASGYAQFIKGWAGGTGSFGEFAAEHYAEVYRDETKLLTWKTTFSQNAELKVRLFDRIITSPGLISDFADAIGANLAELLHPAKIGRMNTSPGKEALASLRLLNQLENRPTSRNLLRRPLKRLRRIVSTHPQAPTARLLAMATHLTKTNDLISPVEWREIIERARKQWSEELMSQLLCAEDLKWFHGEVFTNRPLRK